jgi:PEP-CTERM motif-containing protein
MKKTRKTIYVLSSAALAAMSAHSASGAVIAQWTFNAAVPPNYNTPAPTTDNSVNQLSNAFSIGMSNTYTYAGSEGPGSSGPADDVTQPDTPTSNEYGWRIRGTSNTSGGGAGQANGWNNAAPDGTQGAVFEVDTTNYNNVSVSFDWYCTGSGVGNLEVLYSTNGTTFNAVPGLKDFVAVSGGFYGTTTPNITVSLSGLSGVANDPNFAVEFVSVRPVPGDANYVAGSTHPGELANGNDGNYASSKSAGTDYNNSSGNWSFNNITVSGTAVAVPEPASLSLLGLSGLALLNRRRNKKA